MNRRSFLQTIFPIGLSLLSFAAALMSGMLLTSLLALELKTGADACRKLVFLPVCLSGLAAGLTLGKLRASLIPELMAAAVMAAAMLLMGLSAPGNLLFALFQSLAVSLSALIGGAFGKSVGKRRNPKPGKAHVRARPRRRPL